MQPFRNRLEAFSDGFALLKSIIHLGGAL
jgi:hypothetical protein